MPFASGKPLSQTRAAVFGLARSGMSAVRLLIREGAQVLALDQRPPEAFLKTQGEDPVAELQSMGARLALGENPTAALLSSVQLLVVSPGIPLELPAIREARAAGVEVIGEVELARRLNPKVPMVGITGTNGKSTTTALTGELFSFGGQRPFVGGNLGRALSEACLDGKPWDVWVVELSSYQLEGIEQTRVNAAAVLNLAPDHLDRYADLEAYGRAKARIFLNQQVSDVAVVNADDPHVLRLAEGLSVPVFGFSLRPAGGPWAPFLRGVAYAEAGGQDFVLPLSPPSNPERYHLANRALRGPHNVANAMAAALLARLSGVSVEAVQRGLDSFRGLAHRLESVRMVNGVEWINDSKATNVDSSKIALASLEGPIWLIAGGRGKGAPYAPLVAAGAGKVEGVLTIGEDAPAVGAAFEGTCPVHPCETLERAVELAFELAHAPGTVLLSPACASFDQFRNFEARGEAFKLLVERLERGGAR